ncbi:MAG: PstS family phosphate ABC transporter substrate-binding protein [Pseudomonadota bacterium]
MTAHARDQLRIVGSSTVFPFVAAAAEQFGRGGLFRTPIVEATGTGGGIKMFCEGVGADYPDMVNASRPIKDSEVAQCASKGVSAITEIRIGFDGIVLANAREATAFPLTRRILFLALARDVPRDGKLIANPYTRWQQIDASLPDSPIEVYGPPPSSGTRDAFSELVMGEGCALVTEMKALVSDRETLKHRCMTMREDGVFIEAGEDDNLIVQKLINNPGALGVFGYSFLESNAALVKANAVDGVMPSYAAIEGGNYHVARSLYVYVKDAHLKTVAGLGEFARELTSDAASGEDGYLIMKGLLPLPKTEHNAMKKVTAGLRP